jgi:hypothetical protein
MAPRPSSSRRRPAVIAVTASAAVLLAIPIDAVAQASDDLLLRAMVQNLGEVLNVSPLQAGDRESGADLNVYGTVTVRQNGPHRLQVLLTELHTSLGPGGREVVNDVFARVDDALILLGTETWVTLATGPGTPGLVHSVAFLVRWGPDAPRRPADALALPLSYQVVPLDDDGLK